MLTWLTTRIDSRPLGLARIVLGFAAAIRSLMSLPILIDLTRPDTLRAPYAEWLPDPSLGLALLVIAVWFISAILFMLGYRVVWSGGALLAAIAFTLSLDQQTYNNHIYLMAWLVLLMVLADSGAGLALGRSDRPVVRWPVLLVMAQVSIVYGFSAITKLNEEFLSGRVLASIVHEGLISLPDALMTPGVLSLTAIVVVVVELFLAVFLWRPNLRPLAFVAGLALHTGITLLMEFTGQLFVFSLEMLALYPLFLDRDRLQLHWNSRCMSCAGQMRFLARFDVLGVIDAAESDAHIQLTHLHVTTRDSAATSRVLEYLVPWLWVAPLLRLPGLSRLFARLYARRPHVPTVSEPAKTAESQ